MRTMRQLQEELGGTFRDPDENQPEHFGDASTEVQAARESAIVVDRSERGKLLFTGEDRASFLHGMLTNTVEGLEDGDGNHAALTDAKGSTRADMWVYHWGDSLAMETEPGLQSAVSEFLDKYIIADDVTISEVSSDYSIVGLHGPAADQILDVAGGPTDLGPYQSRCCEIEGVRVRVCKRSYCGELGYDLWVAADWGAQVFEAVRAGGAQPAGQVAVETLRIESGMPRYGLDVDDRVIPLEGGMADTVDFTKGCFIGQEVLAKMHNLGQPRRYLVGVLVEGQDPPVPETELVRDGKTVGLVKSGVYSEAVEQIVCLASVRRGNEASGTQLTTPADQVCEVVSLPFVEGKSLSLQSSNLSA